MPTVKIRQARILATAGLDSLETGPGASAWTSARLSLTNLNATHIPDVHWHSLPKQSASISAHVAGDIYMNMML